MYDHVPDKIYISCSHIHITVYFKNRKNNNSILVPFNFAIDSSCICKSIDRFVKATPHKRWQSLAFLCGNYPAKHINTILTCNRLTIVCNRLAFFDHLNRVHTPVIHWAITLNRWAVVQVTVEVKIKVSISPVNSRLSLCKKHFPAHKSFFYHIWNGLAIDAVYHTIAVYSFKHLIHCIVVFFFNSGQHDKCLHPVVAYSDNWLSLYTGIIHIFSSLYIGLFVPAKV